MRAAKGEKTEMRLVGGLMGVTLDDETLTVEPECAWVLAYGEPVDPPSEFYQMIAESE